MSDLVLSQHKDRSIFAAVTMRIVAALEAGAGEYRCPWHTNGSPLSLPFNASTLAEYRGLNVLALWVDALSKGYPINQWATYKQWQSLGAQVRRKERGSLIVFYKQVITSAYEDEDPDQDERLRFVAKPSWVFNAAQVDGYTPPDLGHAKSEFERCREFEAWVDAVGATIAHGYSIACYRRSTDTIEMPSREAFIGTPTSSSTESYYATLLHELTHWTGAPHRLDRKFGRRFGDDQYAMEELVAELGAAFACAASGIAIEPRPDHAAYIAHWLAVLKRDSRAVFTAASEAQIAFDHLCYLAARNDQPNVEADPTMAVTG
jgi:antirestriction protein ArdC